MEPLFGGMCGPPNPTPRSVRTHEEDTFALQTMAHFRGNGIRPYLKVEPTDHPLALDQRNGITIDRAWELIHHYMN